MGKAGSCLSHQGALGRLQRPEGQAWPGPAATWGPPARSATPGSREAISTPLCREAHIWAVLPKLRLVEPQGFHGSANSTESSLRVRAGLWLGTRPLTSSSRRTRGPGAANGPVAQVGAWGPREVERPCQGHRGGRTARLPGQGPAPAAAQVGESPRLQGLAQASSWSRICSPGLRRPWLQGH